eukprot:15437288-Alexandrium_andersonii.AAC.1
MKGVEGKQRWMPNRHTRVIGGAATLYSCASMGTTQARGKPRDRAHGPGASPRRKSRSPSEAGPKGEDAQPVDRRDPDGDHHGV